MPHQCLKCGKVFPSGSMEIFRGCSNCKGKRFFYTEQPISEDERKELTARADKDIKELVRDLLTQRDPERFQHPDIAKDTDGWVKVDKYKKLGAVDKETIREAIRQTEGPMKPIDKPQEIKSKLQQILDEELGGISPRPEVEKVAKTAQPAEKPIKEKAGREPKISPKKSAKQRVLKTPPAEKRPEVIKIVEPGVYEIDVERLMDRSPIIILKDGTYLVHLPSLLKKPEEK
ncbi:MAG: hypothetical protein JSV49_08040 [Thermoplasmata archaeon]|nr:MAG: hypothetical protein JSV49_08040 [Thermoplasmata archaeon]